MRRPYVLLTLLVCAAAAMLAMLTSGSIETTGEPVVTPRAINFGEVKPEDDKSRRLTIRNPSDRPTLVRIAADCSCVRLSHREIRVPPGSEATVDVVLNRGFGEHRDQFYTFLESELEVTAFTPGGTHLQLIPVRAKFFEPYMIDRAGCQLTAVATELEKRRISFSAGTPRAGRPTIGRIPTFVESVEVKWNEELKAGELLVTVKRDTPPGVHGGHIEMHPTSAGETSLQPYLLTLEARALAPYRFSPGAILLGGFTDVDSQLVTLEGIAGARCSIASITCDSDLVRLEKNDDVTFTVQRADAGRAGAQDSPVTYVAIDVEYDTDSIPLVSKEYLPVYVTSTAEGDDQ